MIAEKIRKKREDYVLALKMNQSALYEEVKPNFSDPQIRKELWEKKRYASTCEKARGQIEKLEYYQAEVIGWLGQKKEWKEIKAWEWKKRRYKMKARNVGIISAA